MDPVHQLRERDPRRVLRRTIRPNSHDRVLILKLRPLDVASFDDAHLHPRLQGNFNRGTRRLAIAHSGMSIS